MSQVRQIMLFLALFTINGREGAFGADHTQDRVYSIKSCDEYNQASDKKPYWNAVNYYAGRLSGLLSGDKIRKLETTQAYILAKELDEDCHSYPNETIIESTITAVGKIVCNDPANTDPSQSNGCP